MDTVKILDRYFAGDEFQRPIESAIEEITTLRQRVAELEKERDELLKALERSLESFEYIAKYGNSCGHSQLRIPDLKAAIANVKEKA